AHTCRPSQGAGSARLRHLVQGHPSRTRCAELVVFILGFLLTTKILKRSAAESILLAMSCVIANNAFYVLPIALQLYGPVSAQPFIAQPFIAITALDALVRPFVQSVEDPVKGLSSCIADICCWHSPHLNSTAGPH
ncbi:hypothetical protein, partial [Pacificibacter sp. AS14]|uniref:hypothetical protein n=1 Tax=Pacificibacter sp. AS14 TaxID=3135785 RepID=UPI00318155F3